MSTTLTLSVALGLSIMAQAAPSLAIPEVASLGASATVIGTLIWLLQREKAEKSDQRRDFLDALKANTVAIEHLTARIEEERRAHRG